MKSKFLATSTAVALVFSIVTGCSTSKKIPYIEEAETLPIEVLAQPIPAVDPIIVPGDLLNINVSAVDMTSVVPFNKGQYLSPTGAIQRINANNNASGTSVESSADYYLVNNEGEIDFPIIGAIKVGGLTKSQVVEEIQGALYPRYLKEEPNVDIRLMNFRVTVAGAVKNPGVVQSKNERLTLLEALALAGDLDIRGERESVKLVRTNPDGSREVHVLDLNDKNLLLSPYFTLQQNDYIYITPNKALRQTAWSMHPAFTATLTVVGGISSLAGLVIGIINLTKN